MRHCIWVERTIGSFQQQQKLEASEERRAASHWAATDCALWRIQFGCAAHQPAPDLHATNPICLQPFVRTIRVGSHTVIPIQFAPSVAHVPNVAEHKVTLFRGQWRLNGEINTHTHTITNTHTSGLPCKCLSKIPQLSWGGICWNVDWSRLVLWRLPSPWNHLSWGTRDENVRAC